MDVDFVFPPNQLKLVVELPPNLHMRPLHITDFDKGYIDLLSQLTTTGNVTREAFERRFKEIQSIPNTYYIIVIEDVKKNQVIANGTIVLERKFTHQTGLVGHIEDVVVDANYRGQQLGKIIIDQLKETGRQLGVYKIILDCTEKNVEFYERCGFSRKELQMAWYIQK